MTGIRADLLAALPGIIAENIHAVMPALRECRGFTGRLDVEEIRRLGIPSPAVLVSRLSARQQRPAAGPHHTYLVRFAAFVVSKSEPGRDRHEAATRITQVLLGLIPDRNWGLDEVGSVRGVEEVSLQTPASEKAGVGLWAVSWEQEVTVQALPADEAIALDVYLGQSPAIGEAHQGNYERIGGAV